MSAEGSVTFWLGQVQVGDRQAVEHLWNRYFSQLVGLARQKLRAGPRRAADEGRQKRGAAVVPTEHGEPADATRPGCPPRSITRKLQLIRDLWEREVDRG